MLRPPAKTTIFIYIPLSIVWSSQESLTDYLSREGAGARHAELAGRSSRNP
ncbi:hypothetical protein LHA01_21010 [Schleiferilactobacillus harbinensis]|nr:hypothetical protein LHA01_21010 [Schleiferilactobacillus harbinensis]